jgi:hypothetical protein
VSTKKLYLQAISRPNTEEISSGGKGKLDYYDAQHGHFPREPNGVL